MIKAVEWRDGKVRFLDQTKLPQEEVYVESDDFIVIAQAIKDLAIRGAPLIGIAAAYGVALAAFKYREGSSEKISSYLDKAVNLLLGTRPTGVNLAWALERQRAVVLRSQDQPLESLCKNLLGEALAIHKEDEEMCRNIGERGADVLPKAASVLTHCNTGSLATGGKGTALGVIETAWERGILKHVYVDETRPLLQGSRLTLWELKKLSIPATLITDGAAAFLMQRGQVNMVIVGADRITLNGDVANKVGTYNLAVLARFHEIPFFVAAPTSTIDFSLEHGRFIPIEQRSSREVLEISGKSIAPAETDVYSPAFDVTPHELVSAIITERGVLHKPYRQQIESIRDAIHREERTETV